MATSTKDIVVAPAKETPPAESHRPASPLVSPTLSPASLVGSMYSAPTISPEVNGLNETLAAMKGSLGSLGQMFDTLGQQTAQMVQIGGELETASHLNKVRKEMEVQDRKVDEQVEEIKELLQRALQIEIVEHLRQVIEGGILEQIDREVKEHVAQILPSYFPQDLVEEVETYKQQLDEVQRALHNSESRRANSQLRSNKLTDPLHTIYKTDGTISTLFPRDVKSLFSMDAETAIQLLEEYGMSDVSTTRERNVNRFMQFCGVSYQLVRRESL
ncbi:hypothetical protein EIP91_004133 [Steccherinum ochraceum]|uniref:Uncharacterized protein n=1 Tax=Steccherinum ochraceum TaxID=92696 RepID=A0A4R0RBT5_9APHY|nr:hypothetical protein EIP91_004133 [Steccherinum ochraceum]